MIDEGNSEVFGAPVLNASTDGEEVLTDPEYNPAAPAPVIVVIEEPEPEPEEEINTLWVTDEEAVAVAAIGGTSLIIILVTAIVLLICCAGIGAMVWVSYRGAKTSKQLHEVKSQHQKS